MNLPGRFVKMNVELLTLQTKGLYMGTVGGVPTSITNMTPGNPFIRNLAGVPIADGVVAHSIIAVDSDGPLEEGGDGVVKYRARISTESHPKRSSIPVTQFREIPKRSRK